MSKPEDISQEAWDEAETVQRTIGWYATSIRIGIARAIMAATLAEREACADLAEKMDNLCCGNAVYAVSVAIRDRSKPLPNPLDPQ